MRFSAIAYLDRNGVVGNGNTQLIELLPPGRIGHNKTYRLQIALDGKNFIDAPEGILNVNTEAVKDEYDFNVLTKKDIKKAYFKYVDQKTGKEIAKTEEYRCYNPFKANKFGIEAKEIEGYELVESPELDITIGEQNEFVYKYKKIKNDEEKPGTGSSSRGHRSSSKKNNETKEEEVKTEAKTEEEKIQEEKKEYEVKKVAENVSRISGKNRTRTSVSVSRKLYPKGTDTVIIANGNSYSDVLSSLTYGKLSKAPILYTNSGKLPEETLREIKRLGAKKVVILGGNTSVNNSVEKELEGKFDVDRIKGSDRYETSKLLFNNVKAKNNSKDIIIANGENFADALSASTLALKADAPIILTNGKSADSQLKEIIAENKDKNIYIIGGENSVSKETEEFAKKNSAKVVRVAGKNRYETSVKVAELARPDAEKCIFASGENFADAVVAGQLTDVEKAPVVLVKKNNIDNSTKNYIQKAKAKANLIVGGANTVNDAVAKTIGKIVK